MPRRYRCKKCGNEHGPPTGKHCRASPTETEQDTLSRDDQILTMLSGLQSQFGEMDKKFGDMDERMKRVEERREPASDSSLSEDETADAEQEVEAGEEEDGSERATPDSIRQDMRTMARAAERLAQLRTSDYDDEDPMNLPRPRGQGRKSGSQMMASDIIRKTVDWPHMHVQRMVGGRQKCIAYADLKVEEFVYGFLVMIRAPNSTMNRDQMLIMLEALMQDTVDFSWHNARGFYEMVGLAVEKGTLKWSETDIIHQKRMAYSRTVFPDAPKPKDPPKTQNRVAPPNTRCCAAFQKRSCEHQRDHPPYSHVCAYCHKTANMAFRHPESDCYKRMSDETKNGKGGE